MEQTFVFCDDCNGAQRSNPGPEGAEKDLFDEVRRLEAGNGTNVVQSLHGPKDITYFVIPGVFQGTRGEALQAGWTSDEGVDTCSVCNARANVQERTYKESGLVDATGHQELGDSLAGLVTKDSFPSPFVGGWHAGPSAERVAMANEQSQKRQVADARQKVLAEAWRTGRNSEPGAKCPYADGGETLAWESGVKFAATLLTRPPANLGAILDVVEKAMAPKEKLDPVDHQDYGYPNHPPEGERE